MYELSFFDAVMIVGVILAIGLSGGWLWFYLDHLTGCKTPYQCDTCNEENCEARGRSMGLGAGEAK
jgi:hypothetical protein